MLTLLLMTHGIPLFVVISLDLQVVVNVLFRPMLLMKTSSFFENHSIRRNKNATTTCVFSFILLTKMIQLGLHFMVSIPVPLGYHNSCAIPFEISKYILLKEMFLEPFLTRAHR